jgi:hypothetical protein
MCFPLAIPLALMAGGSIAQYFGNKQAENASLNAYHTEQARQKVLTGQQQDDLNKSNADVKDLQNPASQQDAINARKQAFMEALSGRPADQGTIPGVGTPALVSQSNNKIVADQRAGSEQSAGALAALTGPNDALFKTNIALNRNSQDIGQLGTTKADSAAVLNAELAAAKYKGGFLRGIGSLAQSIGGAMAGGIGGSAGGAVSNLGSPDAISNVLKSGYSGMAVS